MLILWHLHYTDMSIVLKVFSCSGIAKVDVGKAQTQLILLSTQTNVCNSVDTL